ncbi:NUDIX domain-containing protein [Clostridium sp. KNHs214]|uniref:NUDIX hydrolase n=1 Tax=Clostridium sp. KNHs214 TaxID=1540257 RepID=UPI0006897CD1|nr:NUDIX domain-containing protein [Clostridium sp. KNHs214]
MNKRVNVQAFVFSNNPSFKVLILKRTPDRSGYWQPVCGGIENDESSRDAVIREVFEETGITDIKNIIDLNYTFNYRETKNGILMDMTDICFAVEVDGISHVRISYEHEAYKWCSYTESKKYLNWKHNLIALDRLMKLINT